jgi:uncharacterized repeat protein (TIGR01451 family)
MFSAPVIAGGLAWAVNAADNQAPLMTRAPQAQNGKIFYFSRGGKSGTATTAANAADSSADAKADDADAGDTPAVAQRYVRNRPVSSASANAAVKNYQDLFSDNDAQSDSNSTRQASATSRTAKPATASKANRQAIVEECGVNDGADADETREDVPLPAAGKTQQVSGKSQSGGVQHADHQVKSGSTRRTVEQVSGRAAAPKGRPAPASAATTDAPAPAEEDTDAAAPAPPPVAKSIRTPPAKNTKAAPAVVTKTTKPAATTKPAPATAVKPVRKPQPAATPKVQTAAAPAPAEEDALDAVIPAAATETVTSATSSADVPMVSLRWSKTDEINVGQECKCGLVVKNTGKLAAKDIVVEAYFPRTVKLLDAEPFPSDSKDHLVWIFEHLAPGQEKTIEITMIPGRRGELATSATVRFTGVATSVLTVEEPQLALSISGSKDVMVGETLTQVITVSNPGTGIAHDVVVHVKVPEGLEHSRGKTVEMGIGSLGAGETRELRLPLSAISGGDAVVVVEARGASNLSQRAQSAVKIAAPKLTVELAGPGLRYVNRHAQYQIAVTNEGIAATDNVRIVHLIPEGFDFLKADRGGKFDAASGSVSWFVGRLEAGQSMQVAVDLNAKQIGEYLHHVQASGENGTIATAKAATRVDGTSAIVMEVSDLDDPVEVGTQTAYEIRIRNDGSKAAQNLRVTCELPPGVELIDTKGPTDPVIEKGVLHFKAVGELPAGSKTAYLIRVNGRVAGNLRMRAKLTSNASTEPLIVEEMTKFYAD